MESSQNKCLTLLGIFESQEKIFDKIILEIKRISPKSPEETAYLGYLLHNLYCGLEEVFKYTASTFENNIDDPTKYHIELLNRMNINVPDIRPALVDEKAYKLLDTLRGFRHIFRHSYQRDLRGDLIQIIKNDVIKSWPAVVSDIKLFKKFLSKSKVKK